MMAVCLTGSRKCPRELNSLAASIVRDSANETPDPVDDGRDQLRSSRDTKGSLLSTG